MFIQIAFHVLILYYMHSIRMFQSSQSQSAPSSRGDVEITRKDCPDCALPYKGKFRRNCPDGSTELRKEYVDRIVLEWVKTMSQNKKYDTTPASHRANYLRLYLKNIRGLHATPKELMLEAEWKLAEVESEDDDMELEDSGESLQY